MLPCQEHTTLSHIFFFLELVKFHLMDLEWLLSNTETKTLTVLTVYNP